MHDTNADRPMKGIPKAPNGEPPDPVSEVMLTLNGVGAVLFWLSLAIEAETDGGIDVAAPHVKKNALSFLTRSVEWAAEAVPDLVKKG